MKYALVALDMDGTLLNSNHETTEFTREAISLAAQAGGIVALCTGRCLSELRDHLKQLPGVRYAICENGASLYDVRADAVLSQAVIPDVLTERVLGLLREFDVCVQCFFGQCSHIQLENPEALKRYHIYDYLSVFRAGSVFTPDVSALWRERGEPMEKINLYFRTDSDRRRFRQALDGERFNISDSLGIGIELSPPGASKALGLKALCRRLDLPVERTLAVGDGGNDLELMEAAGFSVAMGNAAEAVKHAADAITDDCDRDGAAKAVLRYMLGRTE